MHPNGPARLTSLPLEPLISDNSSPGAGPSQSGQRAPVVTSVSSTFFSLDLVNTQGLYSLTAELVGLFLLHDFQDAVANHLFV